MLGRHLLTRASLKQLIDTSDVGNAMERDFFCLVIKCPVDLIDRSVSVL